MDKISPCLWFDHEAEEAARFYCSIFPRSKVTEISYYGDNPRKPKGSVLVVAFELDGRSFLALNGGPQFKFSEAISMSVSCASQAEVDALWARLSAGGQEGVCGWLKDRYGLSWQIVPARVIELMSSGDASKAQRAFDALMKMRKIDIAAVQRAVEQA